MNSAVLVARDRCTIDVLCGIWCHLVLTPSHDFTQALNAHRCNKTADIKMSFTPNFICAENKGDAFNSKWANEMLRRAKWQTKRILDFCVTLCSLALSLSPPLTQIGVRCQPKLAWKHRYIPVRRNIFTVESKHNGNKSKYFVRMRSFTFVVHSSVVKIVNANMRRVKHPRKKKIENKNSE